MNAIMVACAVFAASTCQGQERYSTNGRVLDFSTHWTWDGREGEEMPMRIYTNCEEASLELNGKMVCRK